MISPCCYQHKIYKKCNKGDFKVTPTNFKKVDTEQQDINECTNNNKEKVILGVHSTFTPCLNPNARSFCRRLDANSTSIVSNIFCMQGNPIKIPSENFILNPDVKVFEPSIAKKDQITFQMSPNDISDLISNMGKNLYNSDE